MNEVKNDVVMSSSQDVQPNVLEQGKAKGHVNKKAKRIGIASAACGALLLGALTVGTLADTDSKSVKAQPSAKVATAATAKNGLAPATSAEFAPIPHADSSKSIEKSSTGDVITSVRTVSTNSSYNYYVQVARDAAVRNGINPDLFVKQIQQESGFNPNARSWVGAAGIAQFMPATAAEWGVNVYDPVSSLDGAARFMAHLNRYFNGNYTMAVAAYNAGPGNVEYAVRAGGNNWVAYLPAETQHYVQVILG